LIRRSKWGGGDAATTKQKRGKKGGGKTAIKKQNNDYDYKGEREVRKGGERLVFD